jgi:DNA-binding transcriptional LysR family regulator
VNLKFLETFLWVVKLRSFSLAADKLQSTQVAVSSRISMLEQELGAKLFKRDPKGVTLTRAGEREMHHAEQVSRTMTELYASRPCRRRSSPTCCTRAHGARPALAPEGRARPRGK